MTDSSEIALIKAYPLAPEIIARSTKINPHALAVTGGERWRGGDRYTGTCRCGWEMTNRLRRVIVARYRDHKEAAVSDV